MGLTEGPAALAAAGHHAAHLSIRPGWKLLCLSVLALIVTPLAVLIGIPCPCSSESRTLEGHCAVTSSRESNALHHSWKRWKMKTPKPVHLPALVSYML